MGGYRAARGERSASDGAGGRATKLDTWPSWTVATIPRSTQEQDFIRSARLNTWHPSVLSRSPTRHTAVTVTKMGRPFNESIFAYKRFGFVAMMFVRACVKV